LLHHSQLCHLLPAALQAVTILVIRGTESGMKSIRIALIALTLVIGSLANAGPAEDFAALVNEAWEWRLAENPVFASRLGDRRYNDKWADRSLAAVDRRHKQTREFLRRVYAIDRTQLSTDDQLNYELFRRDLQDSVDAHQFNGHLMPFSHRGGVQTLDGNTNYLRFDTVKDYDDWLARLRSIDELIEQTVDRAERGRKSGYMPPKILMRRIPGQLASQIVDDPALSPFMRIFDSMPESVSAADQQRLRAAALEAIEEDALPA